MSYLQRIQACHRFDQSLYRPFIIEGQRLGWIRPDFAKALSAWPELFHIEAEHVRLNPELTSYEQRTTALEPVIRELHEQNIIDTWVGEAYPATLADYDEKGFMQIERAATLYFGLRSYGVHVNGLVKKQDGIYIWIAVRSINKPFYPGKLDQMVAGGQPVGISIRDNLIKEAAEEAAIPAEMAKQAEFCGCLSYRMDTERGVEPSTLYNFDLWLPEDFVPKNTDGEVDEFLLVKLEELARITEFTSDFKSNCNLVNIDLLLRKGLIADNYPDYQQIKTELYQK